MFQELKMNRQYAYAAGADVNPNESSSSDTLAELIAKSIETSPAAKKVGRGFKEMASRYGTCMQYMPCPFVHQYLP